MNAVRRIWKEECLRLKRKSRRRLDVPRQAPLELTAPNQAWCLDFVQDRLENGRRFRILAVLDCFTRECLLLRAATHYPGSQVQRDLWSGCIWSTASRCVRCQTTGRSAGL